MNDLYDLPQRPMGMRSTTKSDEPATCPVRSRAIVLGRFPTHYSRLNIDRMSEDRQIQMSVVTKASNVGVLQLVVVIVFLRFIDR